MRELSEELKIEINKMINHEIDSVLNEELWNKAPIIIHQRFCRELVEVMKKYPTKVPKEVPEAMNVLVAIEILEKLYPQLNEK